MRLHFLCIAPPCFRCFQNSWSCRPGCWAAMRDFSILGYMFLVSVEPGSCITLGYNAELPLKESRLLSISALVTCSTHLPPWVGLKWRNESSMLT